LLALGRVLLVVLPVDLHVPDLDCKDVVELGDVAKDFGAIEPGVEDHELDLDPQDSACPMRDSTTFKLLIPFTCLTVARTSVLPFTLVLAVAKFQEWPCLPLPRPSTRCRTSPQSRDTLTSSTPRNSLKTTSLAFPDDSSAMTSPFASRGLGRDPVSPHDPLHRPVQQ